MRCAIGLGCAPIGNLYEAVSDADALATLTAAASAGWAWLDTAPYYGHGLSEERIGAYLGTLSGRLPSVSTKIGRRLEPCAGDVPAHGFANPRAERPVFDYSYRGTHAAFEASLDRLGVSRVDSLLVHDLGRATHGAAHRQVLAEALGGAFAAARELQRSGQVGEVGVGVNEWEIVSELLGETRLDCVLLAGRHTLIDQSAHANGFFALCAERGTRVILGGVFNSGLLAGDPDRPGTTFDYGANVPPAVAQKAGRLADICSRWHVPLPAAALQFAAAHPQADLLLIGARSAAEVEQDAAFLALDIPGGFWDEARREGLLQPGVPIP